MLFSNQGTQVPALEAWEVLHFQMFGRKTKRIAFCDMGKCSLASRHACWSHAHACHLCVVLGHFQVAGADADLLRWGGRGLHFCRHWSEILNPVNAGGPYFYLALSSENCAVSLGTETRWPHKA